MDSGEPYQTQVVVEEIFGPQPIWVDVVGGMAFHQSDIMLGPIENLTPYDGQELYPTGAGLANINRIWPETASGEVEITAVLASCTAVQEAVIIEALEDWEDWTDDYLAFDVVAAPYLGSASDPRIRFDCSIADCWSNYIGMSDPGPQTIAAGTCPVGSVRHEIGHSLGLFHEHARRDRDDFVDVHWSRLTAPFDFTKYTTLGYPKGADIGPFSFISLMMYSSCAFNLQATACEEYFIDQLPGATYVVPSMTEADADTPYEPADAWTQNRVLDVDTGDLYAVARLYTDAWYVSTDATGDWVPANWHSSQGADDSADELIVGKFCNDSNSRTETDDILWYRTATDDWWAVCDAGYPGRYRGGADHAPVQLFNLSLPSVAYILVGDFDGYAEPVSHERYSDLLVNDAVSGRWYIWGNGEEAPDLVMDWVEWNTETDDVSSLRVGSFCKNSGLEGTTDVIRRDEDGGPNWDVSCNAQTPWHDMSDALGDFNQYLMADFNADGYTDLLRNNPATMELEVAYAIAPDPADPGTEPVTYGSFTALAWDINGEHPGVDNKIPIADLQVGEFANTTGVRDGADLFYAYSNFWLVTDTSVFTTGVLYWSEINDFFYYPDRPFDGPYNGFSTPHPPMVMGNFTEEGNGDFDDVLTQLPQIAD